MLTCLCTLTQPGTYLIASACKVRYLFYRDKGQNNNFIPFAKHSFLNPRWHSIVLRTYLPTKLIR